MHIQTIIVAVIIAAAILYAGSLLRLKIKAFKPKDNSCGAGCGCESRVNLKNI